MITALIALQVLSLATNVGLLLRNRQLNRELRETREDLRVARERGSELFERLIAARKEGYEIPREAPAPAPAPEPESELAPKLLEIVNDWESEDARAAQREVIKQYKRAGLSDLEIVRRLMPADAEEQA